MNEEQTPHVNETQQVQDWKHPFTTVTSLSKFLAMLLFVVLPFAGFGLGLKYGETTNSQSNNLQMEPGGQENSPTPVPWAGAYKGKQIMLSNQHLTEIPAYVFAENNVTLLDVSNNEITSNNLEKIGALKELYVLNLSANNIDTLPSEIALLNNLQVLDIGFNPIATLPEKLYSMTGLQIIFLNGTDIGESDINELRYALPNTSVYFTESSLKKYTNREHGYEFMHPASWAMIREQQAWVGDYLPESRTFVAIWPTTYPAQDFSARIDVYNEKLSTVMDENKFIKDRPFTVISINGVAWIKVQHIDYQGNPIEGFSLLTERNSKTYYVSGSTELTNQILSEFRFIN